MAKRNSSSEQSEANNASTNNTQSNTGSTATRTIPEYLAAALRIPSSYPLGAKLVEKEDEGGDITLYPGSLRPVPGYMVLDFYPTLGVSNSKTSAVNRAAYQQFNAIRSQISGTRPYKPADLIIYQAAIDGLRHLYYKIRMIYGIIAKYSATNLYRPRACLEAMGLDSGDIINHAADMYQWLLTHKDALISFPTVPIGTISLRHQVYNTYIFTDGDIDSTQGYIMNQAAYWSYEKVDEVKGLTPKSLASTWNGIMQMWDEMYAALQSSTDVYVIAADIRRAFPDKYVTELPATPADYTVEYVKLDSFLTTIMNAVILGADSAGMESSSYPSALRISDNMGDVMCEPRLVGQSKGDMLEGEIYYLCYPQHHINTVEATPDASAILAAVRLKPVIDVSIDGKGHRLTTIRSMGTEIISGARIVGFRPDDTDVQRVELSSLVTYYCSDISGDVSSSLIEHTRLDTAIVNFDWHPPIICAFADNNGSISTGTIEDVQNYVPISDTQLAQIFDAYLLYEFGI